MIFRVVLLLGLCLAPVWAAFNYRVTLSTDPSQCGSTDSVNFTAVIRLTHPLLRTTSNGGAVVSSTGADILFYSDALGISQIPSKLESYDASTGSITAHVAIPYLSHTTSFPLYLFFANASPPSRVTGPWDSNYTGVWLLPDGTTLDVTDSVGSNNGTNNNATAIAGLLDGAANFNGSTAYVDFGSATLWNTGTAHTVTIWSKLTDFSNVDPVLWTFKTEGSNGYGLGFVDFDPHKGIAFGSADGSGVINLFTNEDPTYLVGDWHMVVLTYIGSSPGSSASYKLYVDGSAKTLSTDTGWHSPQVNYIGVDDTAAGADYFKGSLDHLTLANVKRSDDWVTQTYNNQKPSSTFFTNSLPIPVNPLGILPFAPFIVN